MKRILAKSTLKNFWEKHNGTEQYLKTWFDTVKKANWKSPKDVKATYGTASIIANNRVVFNIKGNSYRIVAKINYDRGWIFIRFIGTHKEYDKIDANTI
ncbi:MAG TPA: type II toxin-antitoxin system HigB family toxin [Cyclobacteriaceae bacterium]|nr:type II toxin-antitoxin system HigB family toxin [Cyclobacteriaceae bacterium]HRJ82147.1 type II toxin-antitoxin system HigB family toxin [Cyclobacteriaceae bacterium]